MSQEQLLEREKKLLGRTLKGTEEHARRKENIEAIEATIDDKKKK